MPWRYQLREGEAGQNQSLETRARLGRCPCVTSANQQRLLATSMDQPFATAAYCHLTESGEAHDWPIAAL